MINRRKRSIIGILIDPVDYETAVLKIQEAAITRSAFTVSAIAVHGVMTGATNAQHKFRLNSFDLLVPDGQPVRWALNLVHKAKLKERVYGPELTLRTLAMAEAEGLAVYFYGSTAATLRALEANIANRFPKLIVAGLEPSQFRRLEPCERESLAERIVRSNAQIVFVGLGCPRQEVFAYEMRDLLPMPMLAVGAAFAFLGGQLAQAPATMQRYGLEWLYRLKEEPKRLWKRYLYLNPYYLALLFTQLLGHHYSVVGHKPLEELRYG